MRPLIAAFLLALLPLAATAVPGGLRCQVASSAVPTPGLEELVFGSETNPALADARLSEGQIVRLAELDTKNRRVLQSIGERVAKLPAGTGSTTSAELARAPLSELVERFLAEAARDRALLIDVESAREFDLADAAALAAKRAGDTSRWCPLCLAVRRGMEADFAWKAGELAQLSPAQEKEAAELAALRDEVRRQWTASLKAELSAAQLTWLREAQMRWLKATLHSSVVSGMRALGATECEACPSKVEPKCEFCSIVLHAVDEAKSKS